MQEHGEDDKRQQIFCLWVDSSNVVRCRIVPVKRFHEKDFQLTLTSAIQSMPLMYDVPFDEPIGEVVFQPDMSSFIKNKSIVFGNFLQIDSESKLQPWTHCSRSFFCLQEKKIWDLYEIQLSLGFEMEFQLLSQDTLEPIDDTLYCEYKALYHQNTSGTSGWKILCQILQVLEEELQIPIWQSHAESASGQFEIAIGPFDGSTTQSLMYAIDRLVLARQSIYQIAAENGLQATFVPKFRPLEAGNAAHLHLGLRSKEGHNLFVTQPSKAEAFVAGVLDALPSMSVLVASTVNSYERIQPKTWSGAFQCYGYENKEAPIRLITGKSKQAPETCAFNHVKRFELKTMDATSNPYLALGAIFAAGLKGLEEKKTLPPPINQDPANLPLADQPPVLPSSLKEAVERFQQAKDMWGPILGEKYFDLLVKLRQAENEYYSNLSSRQALLQELLKRF